MSDMMPKRLKNTTGNDSSIENAIFVHQFFYNDLKFYDELRNQLS